MARARSDIDGISWSPWLAADRRAGRLTFRVAAGGTAQLPDPLTVLAANETTRPERAGSIDVGISHEVTPGTTWSVDAFVRREWNVLRSVDERVDPVTDERMFPPPFPVAVATLEGRARGVDLVLRRHAPARLAGWVGYTWARARVRDRTTGERFDADFDQRHTLNVVLTERLSYRSAIGMKLRVGSNTPLIGYFESSPDGLRLSSLRNRVRLPTLRPPRRARGAHVHVFAAPSDTVCRGHERTGSRERRSRRSVCSSIASGHRVRRAADPARPVRGVRR